MKPLLSRLSFHALPLTLFLILPLALFWQVTLGGRTLIPADNLTAYEPWRSAAAEFGVTVPHNGLLSDLVLQNYLWKRFTLDSLQQGELPLWNPYLFAGNPFWAGGQHAMLYPFAALYALLPLPLAYGWFTVSQFFLAGLFAYVFLRGLGLSRAAATFGGVAYELSLFMVVSVVFPMIVAGAVWLPLLLWVIHRLTAPANPARLAWVALGGVALGVQILAGHVEITYYTLMVMGGYAAWRLAETALAWRTPWFQRARALAPTALALLGLVALGLALGAVQFIPIYDLAQNSFRSGRATFDEIRGWALPWRHAVLWLIPNFYGNPSHHAYWDVFTQTWQAAPLNNQTIDWGIKNYVEGGVYVGLLTLALVPLALAQAIKQAWTGRHDWPGLTSAVGFLAVLAGLALAFAFGTPAYGLIFGLPGINQLHSPFRWVWPLTLALAGLAAFGLEAARRAGARRALAWAGLGSALVGAGTLAGLAGVYATWPRWQAFFDALVRDLALADRAFTDGAMFFSYTAVWVAQFGLTLLAVGATLWLAGRGWARWPALAVAVLAVDLLAAGWNFNPAADPRLLDYVPPSAAFLNAQGGLWRFTTYDPDGQKPYNANLGWYFGWHDVRGYDSLFTRDYANFMGLIQPQNELEFNRIAPLNRWEALGSPLVDLLNIEYVISLHPLPDWKYTPVYTGEVAIYRNRTALPRAFVLPQTATLAVDDLPAAVQQFDPRQFVMVAPADALGVEFALPAQPQAAQVTHYGVNTVLVEAQASEPAWLVLAEAFDPGWKAFVRPQGADDSAETETPVVRAYGALRAITLPPGAWTVRFRYTPVAVRLGAIFSLVGAVSVLFLLGLWAWRFFYREGDDHSAARRIAKNSLAPMALNLMNRAIDLAFAAFMLRMLGPDEVGKYYFAVVIFGWFDIVTNYGLNTFLTRDVARDRAHANRYLVNTTILRLALGLAAIPALALLLGGRQALGAFTALQSLDSATLWAIGLLVLAQAPATISTGLSALFYAYEKAEYPAAVATVTTLARVALQASALLAGWGIVGLAGMSIAVNVITLLILFGLSARLFFVPRWEFDLNLQKHALREGWPLMLNNLLATLFYKVDVTLLEPLRGPREVGWYSAGYRFLDAFNIVPALFTFALFPLMARQAHQAESRPTLKNNYLFAVKLLETVALPLAVLSTFLAPTLVNVLGGEAFLPQGAVALAVMVWSIPFGWINSVTNYLLISLEQQRGLTRAFFWALMFNVATNLLFIPQFGFTAAAATTIASEIFEGALFYVLVRASLGNINWLGALWKPWASAGGMALITFVLWGVHPALAVAAGGAVFISGIIGLQAFSETERATLRQLLPKRG